jgi:hypothetical protein
MMVLLAQTDLLSRPVCHGIAARARFAAGGGLSDLAAALKEWGTLRRPTAYLRWQPDSRSL